MKKTFKFLSWLAAYSFVHTVDAVAGIAHRISEDYNYCNGSEE